MLKLIVRRAGHAQLQSGITLLESLCAIVILAVGILGVLGVQMRTLTDSQTTVRRAQAIRLIEDLGERIKVNPSGITNMDKYVLGWSQGASVPMTPQASKKCDVTSCDNAELADFDIREWKRTVEQMLPAGNAATFIPLADGGTKLDRRQLGVLIRWRENERHDADDDYKAAIDAGVSRKATDPSEKLSGQPEACPATYTCHLQYLPVSGRCMPDFRGGTGTPQFFCSAS